MRLQYIIVSILSFSIIYCGSISGYITDHDGNPLFGANILVADTEIGITTNDEGYFFIKEIKPGKYSLLTNYIGYYEEIVIFYITEQESQIDQESHYTEKIGVDDITDNANQVLKGKNIVDITISLTPQLLDYDEIVVSASKQKEKIFDAPATISLVNQRKIREFSGNDIGSALNKVKGMDVYQAGNGRTHINTRGFMSVFNGRFVTLLDGKIFSDPIFRTAYNNTYPTIMEDIEKLEIVYGPSSALYGPNAHNGLINVITKHPKDFPGLDVTITNGFTNSQSQRLRYAYAGKKLSYKINIENSTYREWDLNRIYAPKDFNHDGNYSLVGEQFIDKNGNGMIDSEPFFDADHNGVYSPNYSVEVDCFLNGCDIDSETGIPINILGVGNYNPNNVITFEKGDILGNGVWDDTYDSDVYDYDNYLYIPVPAEEYVDSNDNGDWDPGEPFTDRPNEEFGYYESFTDCGYNTSGDYLCEGDEGWDASLGDGMHTGPEGIQLFQSNFENELYTRKFISSLYYQIDDNTEISLEPSIITQKNYIPYDLGYLFTTNTYSSLSSKLNRENFNVSLNADYVNGVIITSEELYNAALKLYNGDINRAVDLLSGKDFNKDYNVFSLYGSLDGSLHNIHPFLNSFIYGLDFRNDAPKTNRNILRDRGSNQKFVFDGSPLPTQIVGEDINIHQWGAFAQISNKPCEDIDLIFANRIDYHSHFDKFYYSPRFAVKWAALQTSNVRFTYNRAHQVPSLFHLFGNIYSQNTITLLEDIAGNVYAGTNPENLDVYGSPGDIVTIKQPYVPLFAGNGYGFTIDDSVKIDPLEVEIVDSYEFGIKGMPLKNLFFDINVYYSKFHNMTSTTQFMQAIYQDQAPFTRNQLTHIGDEEVDGRDILFTYVNLGEIEYYGMDISLEYQVGANTTLFTTYSYYNTLKLIAEKNETPYIGNDWAWTELIQENRDVSPYDIMHFNASTDKVTAGIAVNLSPSLFAEFSGKYNSLFDFESGAWIYTEDDQNQSYLYTGCGCEGFANKFYSNQGPLGGNIIFDMKLNYKLNENFHFKLTLNNLSDADDVRLVGSPPSRRTGLFEINYHL